jgi:hypothetical protein
MEADQDRSSRALRSIRLALPHFPKSAGAKGRASAICQAGFFVRCKARREMPDLT